MHALSWYGGATLSSTSQSGMRHLPALDGLRGLALLGVLFFHAREALPGGFLGVDLFFVLSGYLITSLLLAEHRATARISLKAFWSRRFRRLLPALLALMPAIALYGRYFATTKDLSSLRADVVATLGYVANWRAIFAHKSYWELFSAPSPLEHMWSLAVEEQFYVIWPLLVVAVLRTGRGARAVLGLALGLAALSMIAMVTLYDPANTSRVYFGTDARAAGILAGAALACALPPTTTFRTSTVRVLDVLGGLSAIGLGYAWCTFHGQDTWLYRGGFWLTEAAVLVLVACAVADRRSVVARVLTFRPLTLVGTISYGLYLWHWPVDVVLTPERVHLDGVALCALQFALTFAIAIASYRLLEKPIRTRAFDPKRPLVAISVGVGAALLLVFSATHARAMAHVEMPLEPAAPSAKNAGSLDRRDDPAHASLRVVLFGDSTANSLGWAMRNVRRPDVAIDLLGQDGCTLFDECGATPWSASVAELRPHAAIVVLGGAFMHGLTLQGRWRKACYRGWDERFEHELATRLTALQPSSPDGPRVWVTTVPYPLGPWDTKSIHAEVDCINASIRKVSAATKGVVLLDLAQQICANGTCERTSNGVPIRPDGVHYDVDGAAALARDVLDRIEKSAPSASPSRDGGTSAPAGSPPPKGLVD